MRGGNEAVFDTTQENGVPDVGRGSDIWEDCRADAFGDTPEEANTRHVYDMHDDEDYGGDHEPAEVKVITDYVPSRFAHQTAFYVGLAPTFGERADVRENELLHYAAFNFPRGATVSFGFGVWQGKIERQATITVFHDTWTASKVESEARRLASEFGEDCVLASTTAVDAVVVQSK